MTTAKIDWLLPSTPESLLMLDDPVEGLRPKWLPPGVTGDVLQIDAGGNLAWGESPAAMHWALRAPDGTVDAPSYGFDSLTGTGMMRNFDFPEGDLTFVVKGEAVVSLYSYGPAGLMSLLNTTLTFYPDNSKDIGIGGGNPRNIYAGTSFVAPPGTPAAPSYTFAGATGTGFLYDGFAVNLAFGGQALFSFMGMPDVAAMVSVGPSSGITWEVGEGLALSTPAGEPLTFRAGAADRWTVEATGGFWPGVDAAYDLGDATHQIRDLYLAGQIFVDGAPFGLSWPLLAPNGTEAAPSYSFASDPDSGLHLNGPNNLRLSVGGAHFLDVYPGQVYLKSAHLFWSIGNLHDIGTASNAPRSIYAGTSFLAPDGAQATPAYSFASQPSFGLYLSGGGFQWVMYGTPVALISAGGDGRGLINVDRLMMTAQAAPITPPAGTGTLYQKTDRKLYWKTDAGVETDLTLGGAGSVSWPLLAPNGSAAAPSYSWASDPTTGWWTGNGSNIVTTLAGVHRVFQTGNQLTLEGSVGLGWAPGLPTASAPDLILSRDGPGVLAQKNGANPQKFLVYEDAGAGKYFALEANVGYGYLHAAGGGSMYVGCDAGGSVRIQPNGGAPGPWNFHIDGNLYPPLDNAVDLGSASAQLRSLYVGTSIKLGVGRVSFQPNGSDPEMGFALVAQNGGFLDFYSVASSASLSVNRLGGGQGSIQVLGGGVIQLIASGATIYLNPNAVGGGFAVEVGNTGLGGFGLFVRQGGGLMGGTLAGLYLQTMATPPATPATGYVSIYPKADKKVYAKDDAGLETPLGGSAGPSVVPLLLSDARFPDGTANNLFPQPVERVSVGTPSAGWPKIVALTYHFSDAALQHLMWRVMIPPDYIAPKAVTLVVKWSMVSATTNNIGIWATYVPIVDGTSNPGTAILTGSVIDSVIPVPAGLGTQKETRLTLPDLTNFAAGRTLFVTLSLREGIPQATGPRVLEAAWLEFAR